VWNIFDFFIGWESVSILVWDIFDFFVVWESASILVWDCFDFFCYVGTCFHSGCQLLSQLTNAGCVRNGADQSALASLELLTNADIISYISVHSRSMLLYIIDKLMAVPTARVARKLAPLAFSTGLQLVGGVAPKPPFVHMHSSTHVFCQYSSFSSPKVSCMCLRP
jgi:hypothetical protein